MEKPNEITPEETPGGSPSKNQENFKEGEKDIRDTRSEITDAVIKNKEIEVKRFSIENLSSPIVPETIISIAEIFKDEFDGDQWGQNAILIPKDGSQIKILNRSQAQEENSGRNIETGLHTTKNGDTITHFHDPEIVKELLRKKLEPNGFISILWDNAPEGTEEKKQIVGFTFGYKTTLDKAFEYEWEDPYCYAQGDHTHELRSRKNFLEKIVSTSKNDKRFEGKTIEGETPVFVWNCIVIRGTGKGNGNFWKLTGDFFSSLPNDIQQMITIGEAQFESQAHMLFKRGGALTVVGTLTKHNDPNGEPEKDELVTVISQVSDYTKAYSSKE